MSATVIGAVSVVPVDTLVLGFANRTPLLKVTDVLNGIFGPALYMSLP